jgi:predicted polyphosphate/ATP-dependent NAD kinase
VRPEVMKEEVVAAAVAEEVVVVGVSRKRLKVGAEKVNHYMPSLKRVLIGQNRLLD